MDLSAEERERTDAEYRDALAILEHLAQSALVDSAASVTVSPVRGEERLRRSVDKPFPKGSLQDWVEESRHLLEALPDGIVVINPQGEIVQVNEQVESLFGWERDDLLGQTIEVLVPERRQAGHVAHRADYFAAPKTRPMGSAKVELSGRRKDGSTFPVEISLSPVQFGSEFLAIAAVRDISRRKREEAKFRSLVENIPAVTFFAPLDDHVPELYVSPQIEQLLGFSQKEWLGDPVLWHRQLHPEDRDRWNLQFSPTCVSGTPFRSVYRFVARDGRVVWVHGSANIVRDSEGKGLWLQGVAFDITALKDAEEDRDRFFSVSMDLFCTAGFDGYFKRINPAMARTLGYPMEELLARPYLEFVHPDDRQATLDDVRSLAHGKVTSRFENRYRCQDGSYRWLQWTASPYLDKQLIYAAARDVTREKQDEEALREQARLAVLRASVSAAISRGPHLQEMLERCVAALSEHLDGTVVGVWSCEPGEAVLHLQASNNSAAVREPHALQRGEDGSITPPYDQAWARDAGMVVCVECPLRIEGRLMGVLRVFSRQLLRELVLQTLDLVADQIALGIDRKHSEKAVRQAHAELERRVRERTAALARANETLQEEIVQRKRAEVQREELLTREQEARAEAEASNRSKDEFLAMLSHELRTPLNAMLGWVHLLRAGKLDAAGVQHGLEVLERNTRAQARLIGDLLEVSRIVSGKLVIETRTVDLLGVAKAAVDAIRPTATAKNIALLIDLDPAGVTVSGDPTRLQQVAWNLLSNAVKFTQNGGRVEVRLRPQGSDAELTVSDNGPGIRAELLPVVFERFRQGDSSSTRQHGGLGLGLAIVRHLVELHGGSVTARSEGEGKGASFQVRLPLLAGGLEHTPVRVQQSEASGPIAGLRVLVVDDEPDTRELLAVILRGAGAEVTTADSAAQALAALDQIAVDVMVSDIGMPGEDGYSLMSKLRARPAERGGRVPSMALTAYARTEDRLRALAAGFQLHAAKPIDPGELIAIVKTLSASAGVL